MARKEINAYAATLPSSNRCGWNRSVANSIEAMTAVRRTNSDGIVLCSHIGVSGRSSGGNYRDDTAFHPINVAGLKSHLHSVDRIVKEFTQLQARPTSVGQIKGRESSSVPWSTNFLILFIDGPFSQFQSEVRQLIRYPHRLLIFPQHSVGNDSS